MVDETKQKWHNYLATTAVFFAVLATLSTFMGNRYSTRAIMNQSKASDYWAYYQSKSVKEYLFEVRRDQLDLEASAKGLPAAAAELWTAKARDYDNQIKRYEAEKQKIAEEAKAFENDRDQFQLHSWAFGMAVIFLQVAIVISSVAALMKIKIIWHLSLIFGVIGTFFFVDGFLLFI
ncbi:MAG: DUF4337 domain-containing protein [Deltaproteobacteria bacterium]|nr:DUF4337 domain-containing protein [Deltaproteobacteria bacterium]